MKTSGPGFKHVLLLFHICKLVGAELNRNSEHYALLNSEDTIIEKSEPIAQRNKRELANAKYSIDIGIRLQPSDINTILSVFENIPFPYTVSGDLSFTVLGADITTVCNNVCSCRRDYTWSPEICDAYYNCSSRTEGGSCQCVKQMPAKETCGPIPKTVPTVTASSTTTGETTTSDSLTINTSMATALNGTTNASNGSIQTHTVMTGPRVTTTSIMPSIVNASSDVIRETTASSSLSTAMTPLPLSSTVTSQAMTIASDSTTGAEMISNPTLKSDETSSAITQGETTTSDSLTINTSMATALNGTTNASNGSIQTHTVMTGPRVTTTSIMPSIVNASSDVIRETTASSSLSTAMTPLPLSSTVTSQAMTIASDSTTGAEMISNPTLKSDETSSAITQVFIIPMQFSLNKTFMEALSNTSSEDYQQYHTNISKVLNETYTRFLPGFQWASIKAFRPGSIIVSYDVGSSNEDFTLKNLQNAKHNIIESLQHLNVNNSSFVTYFGNTSMSLNSTDKPFVSDRDPVSLTCNVTRKYKNINASVVWYLDGIQLERNESCLSFHATDKWNGSYTCEYVYGDGLVKSIPDLKNITVYPLPENIFTYDTILMKGNNSGNTINLTCCVDKENNGYSVFLNTSAHPYLIEGHQDPANKLCYIFNYHVENELGETATCIVKNQLNRSLTSVLKISYIDENRVKCNSPPYGVGEEGTISTITCAPDEAGNIIAICRNNTWTKIKEKCKNKNLIMLLDNVKNINNNNTPEPIDIALPKAVEELVNFSVDGTTNIISPGNLETTIEILEQFANSQISSVNSSTMKNFLTIADLLLEDTNHTNQADWTEANSYNGSSRLLQSLENFAKKYKPQKYGSYSIPTNNIELQGVMLNTSNEIPTFEKTFFQNNTVRISKIRSNSVNGDILIVSIGIKKLASLLPLNISNDAKNTNNFSVNGILISTTVNEGITIESISNSFQKNNATLNDVNCVFWNFTNLVWKSDDCLPEQGSTGDIINCTCKHLTSFSILMSYKPIGDIMVLNWITYIGLGISIGSLLLCIFIEKLVWKVVTKNKTSYIRHVSIVNIAISLLIADIWFIIAIVIQDAKSIADSNDAACSTATFFIHFFYLALFFWMFVLGLFLFYRLILVFHDISRTAMVIIAFSLGYGSPFIIAIITIAVTLPHRYKRTDACWLNWDDSKALLAFVIPALVIIAANFIFLLVVVIKIMRPAVGERPRKDEKNTMVQIIRSVAILTPLLGITWAFGVATIVGGDQLAFHVIFTILNAFQGLFILIFATLLDSKVRQALKQKRLLSMLTTKSTKTTTSQPSSGPLSRAVDNVFNRKGQSHGVSDGIHSSSNVSSRAYSVLS